MSAPVTPMDTALAWAAQGVAVLPVRPGEKAPLTRSGLHDATTDPRVLRRWWSRWPAANVAIATGVPGVDVLDVDVRGSQSGWAALRRLREVGIVPAGAPVVRTPSGGVHLYFIGTDQRNGLAPGRVRACSRRHYRCGEGAEVPVAQAEVDQREQLAGDRDGGDVAAAAVIRARSDTSQPASVPSFCTASIAAHRTSFEPCFVIDPRRTVVSDS